MASFLVLFKKEIKQQVKTRRLLIIMAIFIIIGILTPLSLNYISEGKGIEVPEYTTVDVVQGHINNYFMFGMFAAILLAMGAVAKERETGTAAMILSKPASCGAFVAAKLAALSITFGTGIAIGALGVYVCTVILFGDINALDFFLINLLVWLFLVVCLAIALMYSSFFKNYLAAGGLALITIFSLAGITQLLRIKDYTPGAFRTWADSIATDGGDNAWGAIVVTLGFVMLTVIIGWQILKSKDL